MKIKPNIPYNPYTFSNSKNMYFPLVHQENKKSLKY